jgi:hypothetical protein
MLIFDWDVIESCMVRISVFYSFLEGLRRLSHQEGQFICFVSEKSREEIEPKLGFLSVSNISLFLNSGREIRVNGRWL